MATETDFLSPLRPTAETPTEIAASQTRCNEFLAAAQRQIDEGTAKRTEMLAKAAPGAIRKFDETQAEHRIAIEMVTAFSDTLPARLTAAKLQEKVAAARAVGDEAAALNEQVGKFAHGRYPALVAELAAGLDLEKRAIAAESRYQNMTAHLQLGPDDVASLPKVSTPYAMRMGERRLCYSVNLPATLPLDTSDETPRPFYRSRPDQSMVGASGTVSAGEANRERNPPPYVEARRLTDQEIEENRRNGLVRSTTTRKPGTAHRVPGTPAEQRWPLGSE